MSRSPNWFFTLNNWSPADLIILQNLECDYMIYCFEVAPSTGTPHLHVYMEFKEKQSWNVIRSMIPPASSDLRVRTKSQAKAIDYCKKDGNFVERGQKKNQGSRSDLDGARVMAIECGMREVTRHCSAQQISVAKSFLTYNEEPREGKPYCIWLWGSTGGGKTRLAHELAKADGGDVYVKSDSTKWYDGYDGHEIAILDDIREGWMPYNDLLTLLDPYPKRVEVKGGWRQWKPRLIILTCPFEPINFLGSSCEDRNQLLRRLDVVEHVLSRCPEVASNN